MDHDVIGQIKREVSLYGQSLGEVGRLRLIRLISRVLGLFLLMFIVLLLVFALLVVKDLAEDHGTRVLVVKMSGDAQSAVAQRIEGQHGDVEVDEVRIVAVRSSVHQADGFGDQHRRGAGTKDD